MKVVYVAHPLSAPHREGIEQNRRNAALWCAWVAAQGHAPSATWIVLTGVLEETPENRELGLLVDCALVERSDEVWMVGGRISSGMALESEHARNCGIPVVDLTHLGPLPPDGASRG